MEATALRMSETRTAEKSDSDKDRKNGGNNAATSFVDLLGRARLRFDGVNGVPAFITAKADKTRLPEQAAPRREEDPRAAPAQSAEKPEPRAKDKADDRSEAAEKPDAAERPKAEAKDKPKAKDKSESKADAKNKTNDTAAAPTDEATTSADAAQPTQTDSGEAAPQVAADEAAPAETDASALVAAQMTQMEILVAPVVAQTATETTADEMLVASDDLAAMLVADSETAALTIETIAPQMTKADSGVEAEASPVDLLADAALPASDFDDLLMVTTAAAKPQTTVAPTVTAQQQAAELAQLAGQGMTVTVETVEATAQPSMPQTARALTAEAALAVAEAPETVMTEAPILDDAGEEMHQQTNNGNQPNANAQGLAQAGSRLATNGALENQLANPNGKAMDAPSFSAALNQAQAQAAVTDGDESAQTSMNRIGGAEAANPSAGPAQNANTAAQQAHAARAMQPARPAVLPQQVTNQISVQIEKAVKEGMDRINIQLRPESLGRVEVRLELASDGRVQATVTADRPETLELLQKDARGLERSLTDAGLKTDTSSLSFSLRQGENQQAQGEGRARRQGSGRNGGGDKEAESVSEMAAPMPRARVADGRVDIRV